MFPAASMALGIGVACGRRIWRRLRGRAGLAGFLEGVRGLLRLVDEAPTATRDVLELADVLLDALGPAPLVDCGLGLFSDLLEVHHFSLPASPSVATDFRIADTRLRSLLEAWMHCLQG